MQATDASAGATALAQLRQTSGAYRRQAWLAVAGLAGFVLGYFALAAWFFHTAWRLTFGSGYGGTFLGWVVALCATFLGVFMLKALVFVKRGQQGDMLEITQAQQPRLFAFLHQLADQAGAPRPHRVFLSPRVNAAVFYDLSLVNLIFPSRKNLEIGLGLVNMLTLGEFRAVLAHEFGHFAQRAMAVGRWVYIAQQIAAHLVARRDKLDDFLAALGRFDLRLAWVGWVMQLVVWSIRSVVEHAFQAVALLQRALSREMEMQADLVSVSLTGSDALIHALLKLQAADDAWDRTLGFMGAERERGRLVADAFAIQTRLQQRIGEILNDPMHGQVPPVPLARPHEHRVFKEQMAQPPRMWLTHPLNHEREANAKRHYVRQAVDGRAAWDIFDGAAGLRERVTADLLKPREALPDVQETGRPAPQPVPIEDSLRRLEEEFRRESLDGRYRGVYLHRSIVRYASRAEELYAGPTAPRVPLRELYPASLLHTVERLRTVSQELGQLRALQAGVLSASATGLRFRGRSIRHADLAREIAAVEKELQSFAGQLQDHDRACRSAHLEAARQVGQGWPEYLQGLLAVLHYADHTEDNLRDLQGMLGHIWSIVSATRKVSENGAKELVNAGGRLWAALSQVHAERKQVLLTEPLLGRLGMASWEDGLGVLELPDVDRANLGQWLGVVDSWVNKAAGLCGALRAQALDELLAVEARLARHVADPEREPHPGEAPAAPGVPPSYATLLLGQERKRERRLDWWVRFQMADGIGPSLARLGVAGGIVAAMLGLGIEARHVSSSTTVTIYNGLARPVVVEIGEQRVELPSGGHRSQRVEIDLPFTVRASTTDGQLIESFETRVGAGGRQPVYNVAAASPLVSWTAVYGRNQGSPGERRLGLPRWSETGADVLFEKPPASISTSRGMGGGTRDVLSGYAQESPEVQLDLLADERDREQLVRVHLRWDPLDAPHTVGWLAAADEMPERGKWLAERLAQAPDNVLLLRAEQEYASGPAAHDEVCQRHTARAKAQPDNPDLAYLATRCLPEGPPQSAAFVAGFERWPQNGWFAYAAAYSHMEAGHWTQALDALAAVRRQLPVMARLAVMDEARLLRYTNAPQASLAELTRQAPHLQPLLSMEAGWMRHDLSEQAYSDLFQGRLRDALGRVKEAGNSAQAARLLRLIAASDGAPAEAVRRAAALPPQLGLDIATAWSTLGLALRDGGDASAAWASLAEAGGERGRRQVDQVRHFIEQARRGMRGPRLESLLDGTSVGLRGYAYSTACIAMGQRAPAAWREAASKLLFATEHPYLHAGVVAQEPDPDPAPPALQPAQIRMPHENQVAPAPLSFGSDAAGSGSPLYE